MRYPADRLGIAIAETVWPDLAEAVTFADMKGRASALVAECASADLAAWIHRRSLPMAGTSGADQYLEEP